jgi:hypothetical protein
MDLKRRRNQVKMELVDALLGLSNLFKNDSSDSNTVFELPFLLPTDVSENHTFSFVHHLNLESGTNKLNESNSEIHMKHNTDDTLHVFELGKDKLDKELFSVVYLNDETNMTLQTTLTEIATRYNSDIDNVYLDTRGPYVVNNNVKLSTELVSTEECTRILDICKLFFDTNFGKLKHNRNVVLMEVSVNETTLGLYVDFEKTISDEFFVLHFHKKEQQTEN